jgi:hypothetical protein
VLDVWRITVHSGPYVLDVKEGLGEAGDVDELDLRASDAERDQTVTELRRHLVDGRLTMEEFDERSGAALRARTRRDLLATLRELPSRVERRRASPPRSATTAPVLPALAPALVVAALVAVAAISGGWWLLWLIWPALILTRRALWARSGRGPAAWYGWGACGGHRYEKHRQGGHRDYTMV